MEVADKCKTCEYWTNMIGCLLDGSKVCNADNSYFHYTKTLIPVSYHYVRGYSDGRAIKEELDMEAWRRRGLLR
jgi:hypothetical protein